MKRLILLFCLVALEAGLMPAIADTSVDDRQAKRPANLFTTTHVNMRAGPGMTHAKVTVVPDGQIVTVIACAKGYGWCEIDWSGQRGWVYTKTLTRPQLNGRFREYAEGIGVPVIEFSPGETGEPAEPEPAGTQVIVQRVGTGQKADRLDGPMSYAGDPNGDLLGGDVGLQKSVGR